MRVIAGAAKGRRLTAPRGRGTRPTSDRVREALFSALQDRLPQARVADLYAGSGALGIEALSRGAATATFVERSRAAHDVIVENLERTGLADDAAVIMSEVRAALRQGLPGGPFDIVFLDPPYDVDELALEETLRLVAGALAAGGVVVVERGRRSPSPRWPPELRPERQRRYGDTVLHWALVAERS
jgi:16S rRNA (guanine966-N2)-methyltransferase